MLRTSFIILSIIVKSLSDMVNRNKVHDKYSHKTKNLTIFSMSQKVNRVDYLIFPAKKAFNLLENAFIKILAFLHFDLKIYIYIKTNAFGYTIDRILSQQTLNNLGK